MKQLPVLIFSLLLALAAIGGYFFMLDSIQTAVDGIAIARADSRSAEERGKLAQTANVFMSETIATRSELGTFVTGDADFVSAIEMIEAAGKREKIEVVIGSVNVKKIDAKTHEIATIILSAKGSFAGLVAFASALESLPLSSRGGSIFL